jgi:hypothetical protein
MNIRFQCRVEAAGAAGAGGVATWAAEVRRSKAAIIIGTIFQQAVG